MIKEILQIISGTILIAAGLGLCTQFLNGLMLIGFALIIAGGTLLMHTVLRAK